MHRCSSCCLLSLAIAFVLALTGCLGNSTPNSGNGGVTSVTLSPGQSVSLDVGTSQFFSATARNAQNGTVLGVDIRFVVSVPAGASNQPTISVTASGNACAGTWDAAGIICSPGSPGPSTITAVVNGVSSLPTTVYVHQHVTSIQIKQAQTEPPQFSCFSQGQTWQYKATAFSNNIDVTNTVGPMVWSSSNIGVVNTIPTTSGDPTNPVFSVQTTAKVPGITQLFASVSGTTSAPYPFTTCLVQYVRLQIASQPQAGNSVTVNNGGSVSITATVVDTLGAIINSPPLTWSTTNPEVIAFSSITSNSNSNSATARNNLGGATLTASCDPPTCNIGITPGLPVYASDGPIPNGTNAFGAISVKVTTTTASPTPYTVWALTTGCKDAPGCTSAMFPARPGVNPIGTIISVPRTPNSVMFNHTTTPRLYIGSDQGLMFSDVGSANLTISQVSASSTPCNVALCGKVLAISNDGKLVVVSDTISTPRQVYIYNASATGSAPVDLIIPGENAIAAAFSPDQLKLFILTDTGSMYVYSDVDALSSVPIATSVTDVKFSADSSFAYVAGTPASSVSAFSTCSLPNAATVDIGSTTTSSTPLQIFPSPAIPPPVSIDNFLWDKQTVLALEPPNVEFLTVEFRQDPITEDDQFTCNPPIIRPGSFQKGPSFNLGQGNFTPIYAQLVAAGNQLVVVAKKIPAVLLFNVNDGTTTSIPLVNGADPLSADASTDGTQVDVAACDQYDQSVNPPVCAVGSVHIINTVTQGDIQQVQYVNVNNNNDRNMCNNGGDPAPQCLPDLVALQPK